MGAAHIHCISASVYQFENKWISLYYLYFFAFKDYNVTSDVNLLVDQYSSIYADVVKKNQIM